MIDGFFSPSINNSIKASYYSMLNLKKEVERKIYTKSLDHPII